MHIVHLPQEPSSVCRRPLHFSLCVCVCERVCVCDARKICGAISSLRFVLAQSVCRASPKCTSLFEHSGRPRAHCRTDSTYTNGHSYLALVRHAQRVGIDILCNEINYKIQDVRNTTLNTISYAIY